MSTTELSGNQELLCIGLAIKALLGVALMRWTCIRSQDWLVISVLGHLAMAVSRLGAVKTKADLKQRNWLTIAPLEETLVVQFVGWAAAVFCVRQAGLMVLRWRESRDQGSIALV